jgi:hypothetical protein
MPITHDVALGLSLRQKLAQLRHQLRLFLQQLDELRAHIILIELRVGPALERKPQA